MLHGCTILAASTPDQHFKPGILSFGRQRGRHTTFKKSGSRRTTEFFEPKPPAKGCLQNTKNILVTSQNLKFLLQRLRPLYSAIASTIKQSADRFAGLTADCKDYQRVDFRSHAFSPHGDRLPAPCRALLTPALLTQSNAALLAPESHTSQPGRAPLRTPALGPNAEPLRTSARTPNVCVRTSWASSRARKSSPASLARSTAVCLECPPIR